MTMAKQVTSGSLEKDKKSSPSKGSKSPGAKSPKPVRGIGPYHWIGQQPLKMAMFSRALGFASVIHIGPGAMVDIDISAQPKSIVQVINIGPGSCINVMTTGETQRIAPTINIGGGSVMNVAVDVKIKGAADAINIAPGSVINFVIAPTDKRCYLGRLNDRSEAIRQWAARVATASMVPPQRATTSIETVPKNPAATAADAHLADQRDKEETGCEMQ